MRKIWRSFVELIGDDDGVAAIEFALLVPMLMVILTGLTDYGLYINTKMQLQALSDRTAQYVAQGGSENDVNANIIQRSSLYTDGASNQTSITFTSTTACECSDGVAVSCAGSCSGSDYVRNFYTATITGTYTPLLPWPGIPDSITLTGSSRLQFAQ